jgi:hypothetical protein
VSSFDGAPESSYGLFPVKLTNKLLLAVTLGLLLFALACGSNGSSAPITGPFSAASLMGSYACRLSGSDSFIDVNNNLQTESYTETLVFKADGAGNLTGTEDFNSNLPAFGFTAGTAFTGTYAIGKDGNGSIQINFSAPASGQINLSITMENTSRFYAVEADAFANFSANASGEGIKQDTTAFAAAPNGTFVMRAHQVFPTTVSSATVGALTSNNGTTVTGTLDVLRNDLLLPQLTVTSGSFSTPDANGRGTLVYADNASPAVTRHFQYYVVDANRFQLMESDATVLGTGSAERQASGSLVLAGNYAFGSSGDTDTTIGGVRSVGVFTAGSGTITGGVLDSVQDGGSILNEGFGATYTQGANGRVDVTLIPSGGAAIMIPEVFWMVSPSRAFFLVAATNKVEDGTIDLQTQATFANTDMKGQYALVMDGYNSSNLLTRIGTFIPDGNGNLNLNEEANSFVPGSLPGLINNPPTLPGTYMVATNGRVTAAINTLSSNLILYLVAPGQAYILQNDTGVEISGKVTLQMSP